MTWSNIVAEIEQQKAAEKPDTVDDVVLKLTLAGYELSLRYADSFEGFLVVMRKDGCTFQKAVSRTSANYLRSPQEAFMLMLHEMRQKIDANLRDYAAMRSQVGDTGE